MAKIHGPSITRATLLYAAGLGVWLWARTPSGQTGQPPYAAVGMLVVAMVAGPVALINFWNIAWGSMKTPRSVPVFLLEIIYSALLPGAFFGWHILRMIR
ncbi:MAG TPA: hypothetical protein VE954_26390 [Oligoflexus sp.]|uniref:hypothetical protein n=1 Tax=Oligoflexus sp. TaxID=1971216 RepID=UPI002D2739FF|nr:hypothetical protein [Oligoflexus sp.]HYX36654.1 hypothetical protein [Oligoflexus sp.]